jgi:hypothetical protein
MRVALACGAPRAKRLRAPTAVRKADVLDTLLLLLFLETLC